MYQPPYVVLKTEEANNAPLQAISLEAISNPFRGMTESIKSNLHSVVSNLNLFSSSNKNNDIHANYHAYKEATAATSKSKGLNYVDIKAVRVVVPVGFTGGYFNYSTLILNHFMRFENIDRDIIRPAHDLILKYIGRPESLMSVDSQEFAKIKLNTEYNELFKKEMNGFFDTKKNHQSQPISLLVSSFKDYYNVFDNINSLLKPWMLTQEWQTRVHRSYIDFQKTVELLMVRIEQKPDVYRLNKLSAERIATLIRDVALELELASAMITYLDQMMVGVLQMSDTVNQSLHDL